MAKSVDIELVSEGIQELLKSAEVVGYLNDLADGIIDKASGSYEKSEHIGRRRANVSIFTTDAKTFYRNLNSNDLLKALR